MFICELFKILDNTFIGTLLAGVFLSFLGLKIYREQKKLDAEYSRKKKIQELAISLLTHINIAVKDFYGQVSVHNGKNPYAKLIFDKIVSISPSFISKETSDRFSKYVSSITQSLNDLSTHLALNPKYEEKVKLLSDIIPQMTFVLSMTPNLTGFSEKELENVSGVITDHFSKVKPALEEIIRD